MEVFQLHLFDNEHFDYNFVSRNENIPPACRELSWISSYENIDLSLLTDCQKLYFYFSFSKLGTADINDHPLVKSQSRNQSLGMQQNVQVSTNIDSSLGDSHKSMNLTTFPPSVHILYLDGNIQGDLDVRHYPCLEYIKVSYLFEGYIYNIPSSCRTLFLRNIFFDISATHIEKICCYYVNFSYLPVHLKYLSVENCVALSLMSKFTNLRVLHLGDWFNSSVKELHFLNQCLEIKFGRNFNNPIDGHLPPNLQKLFIHSIFFNKPCLNLPPHLILLDISMTSYHHIDLSNLPVSLKYLSISNQRLDMLPPGIEYLNSRSINKTTEFAHLPNSLKKIYVEKYLGEKKNVCKKLFAKISFIF